MSWAIGAHYTTTVYSKQYREFLQRNVVYQLVVTSLKERRVDSDDGLESYTGKASSESDGMLLGDSGIEILLGESLRKFNHA